MTGTVLDQVAVVREITVAGAKAGPLAGTSFVAKDLFDVEGFVSSCGNPDWLRTHEPATRTAPAVLKFINAGCTLRGKSNMDELAFGMDGVNIHYGTPVNAQFPNREPGGSSSGSASAVASGLVEFALGSDTAGSVRVPASYCGIFGYRPTHGRISLEGVSPLAPSLDTVGWFARTAEGLRTCGHVLLDRRTEDSGAAKATGDYTILVARDVFDTVSEDLKSAFERALQSLRERGYRLQDINLHDFGAQQCRDTFRNVQGRECWQVHGKWITETQPRFADGVRKRFEYAKNVTEEVYESAREVRQKLTDDFAKLLGAPNTVLCLPTTVALPPLLSALEEEIDRNRVQVMSISTLSPLTSAPQVNIPVKLTDRTATGLGFMAAQNEDENLLDLTIALSRVF